MAQSKTPAAAGRAALERVGPYRLDALLRRDRLGEAWSATGPEGTVRVRVCPPQADPSALSAAVDALAALRHPGLAPVLDHLVDDDGRVAVVTPADQLTLAERRGHGRLDAATVGPLGCVLFDGLAALHSVKLGHGTISTFAVGIDATGCPRWQDAALLPALTGSRMQPGMRAALDVADSAAMLRDLGRLPAPLEAVLDPVAAGVPGAIERAAPLARAWRDALGAAGVAHPPADIRARVPGLLPPAAGGDRRRGAASTAAGAGAATKPAWPRSLSPRVRRVGAGVCIAVALGVVPAAALTPAGRPLADRIDSYAPLHKGLQLTYRLRSGDIEALVVVKIADSRVVAGVWTASLEAHSSVLASGGSLPLGLGGATLRVETGSVVRTAAGGAVRDLVLPLQPGASWRDRRSTDSATTVVETRTLLGPVSLDVGVGHFDRCLAVGLQSATTQFGGTTGSTGSGALWYCPGVGLARAHLEAEGSPLDIELISAH